MRKPGAGLQHQARDFAGVRTSGHRNVLELAAQVALRIGHGRAEQGGQTDACGGARLHEESVAGRGEIAQSACESGAMLPNFRVPRRENMRQFIALLDTMRRSHETSSKVAEARHGVP